MVSNTFYLLLLPSLWWGDLITVSLVEYSCPDLYRRLAKHRSYLMEKHRLYSMGEHRSYQMGKYRLYSASNNIDYCSASKSRLKMDSLKRVGERECFPNTTRELICRKFWRRRKPSILWPSRRQRRSEIQNLEKNSSPSPCKRKRQIALLSWIPNRFCWSGSCLF